MAAVSCQLAVDLRATDAISMIVDKDTGNVLERIPFFIDIAFVSDFDF